MNGELFRQVRSARAWLGATVGLGVLAAVATIAQMVLLAEVVDRVFLGGAGLAGVGTPLLLLLAASAVRSLLLWGREVTAQRGAVRVKGEIRGRLFGHVLRLGPAYAREERTGELATTATEGVERLDAYFARYLPQVLLSVLVPLLIVLYVFPLDRSSAVLLLVTAPVIPIMMILVGSYAEDHMKRQWTALSRLGAGFLDAVQGLPTLKMFGRSEAEAEKVAAASDGFRIRTMKVLRYAFLSGLVLEFMTAMAIALVAVTLGVRVVSGSMPFEEAFLVLLLAPEFYKPLRERGAHRHAGMEGKAAADRIFEVLNTPVPTEGGTGEAAPAPGSLTVEFSGVGYTYPGGERPAVRDLTLTLEAGTMTALVGKSGAGKSTLANLLLRFLDSDRGRILANGAPVSGVPVEEWRESLALVPQRPHLFYGSVLENIRLARPDATREEVERAAELAGAAKFIRELSEGYDTPIGERGAHLSGGEAQRVAIARAFLKDAPILVMDEPTSSLDPESERAVRAGLERLSRGRTVLVVAHRMNTVRGADRIVVMDGGRVVEAGTHEELVRRGGRDHVRRPARRRPGRGGLRTFGRLLGFLRPHLPRVGLAVLLGVATVASNVGLLAVAAYVISAAAIVPLFGYLVLPSYFVRLFGLSRAGARYAERMVSHDLTFRLLANTRTWFYRRIEPLAPARLLGHRSGDLLSRLIKDVEELENLYLRISSPIAVAVIVSLLTALVFYAFDPMLAPVALAFLAATGVGVPLLVARLARGLGRRQLELRAALNARIVDDVRGIQDLLAFGREGDERREIAELDRRLGRVQNRMAIITGLQDSLSDLMMNLAVITVLVLAIPPVAAGEIQGVYLAFLALVMLGSFEAVQPLGRAFQFLGRSVNAGERLFEVADAQPEVADPERPLPVPADQTLRFEDVTFRYDPSSPPVLRNVSLALGRGRRVAVVGPSGAGKSTLVDLALRFWDPSAGRVTLGGRDLRDLAQEDLRARISVVSQDTHVFTDSLRGNLLLAKPEATDDELRAVLERARLLDFAERLPEGLDAYLGEQGLKLSGGERQRLSVARALLKDAPILVLDEPTANLDPGTEGEVLDAAYELVENRATLVITHRLVRMEEMDEIVVLEQGRIVGRGTHEELARARGLYRDLYEAQRGLLVGT